MIMFVRSYNIFLEWNEKIEKIQINLRKQTQEKYNMQPSP